MAGEESVSIPQPSSRAHGAILSAFTNDPSISANMLFHTILMYGRNVVLDELGMMEPFHGSPKQAMAQDHAMKDINERIQRVVGDAIAMMCPRIIAKPGHGGDTNLTRRLFELALMSHRVNCYRFSLRVRAVESLGVTVAPFGEGTPLPLDRLCIMQFVRPAEGRQTQSVIVERHLAMLLVMAASAVHPAEYIVRSDWFADMSNTFETALVNEDAQRTVLIRDLIDERGASIMGAWRRWISDASLFYGIAEWISTSYAQ